MSASYRTIRVRQIRFVRTYCLFRFLFYFFPDPGHFRTNLLQLLRCVVIHLAASDRYGNFFPEWFQRIQILLVPCQRIFMLSAFAQVILKSSYRCQQILHFFQLLRCQTAFFHRACKDLLYMLCLCQRRYPAAFYQITGICRILQLFA